MSAFVVGDEHLDALTRFGAARGVTVGSLDLRNPSDRQHAADLMRVENVASVRHRYPTDPNDLPGPVGLDPDAPVVLGARGRILSPIEAIKAAQCYEYQSCEHPACEHPEWRDRDAHHINATILAAAISALPGYAAAAWEIT